jgi:mono/diheme cytochrome c family protein
MRTLATAGLIMCLTSLAANAAGETPDPNKATYLRYCGACHGREGKGDGVASGFMRPQPTNLTQLAKQNGGKFPYVRVMETIDGRNTVRAHGDPQMPVWGEIFAEETTYDAAGRTEIRRKLKAITEHIQSIPEK